MSRDSSTAKLDLDMQSSAKAIIQRDRVLFSLEEAKIADASKMDIDQLIDIKELESVEGKDKSIAIDNASIIFFTNQSFFLVSATIQNQEDEF